MKEAAITHSPHAFVPKKELTEEERRERYRTRIDESIRPYTVIDVLTRVYVWLYKVRAKPVTENYATKEGKSITRQTGEVEWTAIRRTHDNHYQAVVDEDENGFTAAKGATFLQSVYEPVFATGG